MENKLNNKIISVSLELSEVKAKIGSIDSGLDKQKKNALIKELLQLPDNYNDSIDFIIKNEKVIFYWKIRKVDQQAEELHKNALIKARKGDLGSSIKYWLEATEIDPYNPEYFFLW